jgi:PhnB protein
MAATPQLYLSFNGQCEEAFRFYADRLGGSITGLFTWADAPGGATDAPPGWAAKVMHAALDLGGTVILGADSPPDRYVRPQGFQIMIERDDPAQVERIFDALADGGTIEMPLQETFWSLRFGVLTDRFGIPWSIGCAQPPTAVA